MSWSTGPRDDKNSLQHLRSRHSIHAFHMSCFSLPFYLFAFSTFNKRAQRAPLAIPSLQITVTLLMFGSLDEAARLGLMHAQGPASSGPRSVICTPDFTEPRMPALTMTKAPLFNRLHDSLRK